MVIVVNFRVFDDNSNVFSKKPTNCIEEKNQNRAHINIPVISFIIS